jgi:hypothetical protein
MRRAVIVATVLASLVFGAASAQALTPPIVIGTWPTGVGTDTANLRAEFDSGGLATTYIFEYTTEADYRTKGFVDAIKVPQLGVSIGAGLVLQRVSGLQPDTAYRFRAVATNNLGITVGKIRSLRTDQISPIFSLPDNRGWEMVSPVNKNGGEIQGFGKNHGGGVLQAAAQGGQITYTSASSFSDPLGSPGPNQYLSSRGAASWPTENITLPMLAGSYPEGPTSGVPYELFSSDLSGALVSNGRRCRTSAETQCPVANTPMPGSGAPAGYRNYYVRQGSTGSFKALLTAAPAIAAEDFELEFAGATPDLAHVVLSSCAKLTADATEVPGLEGECDPTKQNLYERSGSTLKLINLLPGQGTGTPGATLAAQSRAISSNGARVYWTDGLALYMREGTQTKKVADGATFQTASVDGSVAIYTSGEHLFRYAAATGISTDLTPGGDVAGVVGASEDGNFVYYLTSTGLYLNRLGSVFQVAPQADPESDPPSTGNAHLSADGRRLVFVSTAELTFYDNRHIKSNIALPEVYLYVAPGTAGAGMTCLSCNPSGERPTGAANLPGASSNGQGALATHVYKPRVLSVDSKRVFFESFDPLAVSDTNGDRDVYQWEASGTGACTVPTGCTDLISSGRAEGGASFIDASADGTDAFFLTDGSLVPTDLGDVDVYDARIDGGFPVDSTTIPCFGDACQALPPAPEDAAVNSMRSKPSGNNDSVVFKRLKCKKGEVKKLGRCVKKNKKSRNRGKKKGGSR